MSTTPKLAGLALGSLGSLGSLASLGIMDMVDAVHMPNLQVSLALGKHHGDLLQVGPAACRSAARLEPYHGGKDCKLCGWQG